MFRKAAAWWLIRKRKEVAFATWRGASLIGSGRSLLRAIPSSRLKPPMVALYAVDEDEGQFLVETTRQAMLRADM